MACLLYQILFCKNYGLNQDKFLNIGGALEVMYSADMMGRIDEKGYISYVYSADTILGRISAKDVRVVDKGLILMEDVFWDFVHNPHLLRIHTA